jgi:hypothetical protein
MAFSISLQMESFPFHRFANVPFLRHTEKLFWNRLSRGFLEPLESADGHWPQSAAAQLVECSATVDWRKPAPIIKEAARDEDGASQLSIRQFMTGKAPFVATRLGSQPASRTVPSDGW